MIKPYYYQENMINSIFDNLPIYDSILCQSATGSGKTVIMSEFIRRWILLNPDKKVLVSVHREELVSQTGDTLATLGILNEKITSKSKNTFSTQVYVGMTQTIWSRKISLDLGLLIIDEAHEQIHVKTFDLFKSAKRIGFTATPVINKRLTIYKCDYCEKQYESRVKCCYNENVEKWSIPVTLNKTYEFFIGGIPIKTLIEENSLVDEVVFSYDYYSELESKGNDDFDENEIAEESAKHDLDVLAEYEEKVLGKKTMIFTASTKQNISIVDTFKNAGYDVMSYDSVNNESNERKIVLEWYKDNQSAILVSTGTFTTGFDDKEVEAVIVNRPTQSLSLWHQMIGRGGRTSKKIYKPFFTVIDLGGNVKRLGKWSDNVDWESIFYNGVKPAKKKKEILIQCDKCSYNWIGSNSDECPDCGYKNKPQIIIKQPYTGEEEEFERVDKKTTSVSVIPIPDGSKIAEFVKRTTDSKNDYYRIIIYKYIELWKLNRVDKEIYFKRVATGLLEVKINEYLKKNYKYVNSLKHGVPRTYEYLRNKIIEKLKACYS
jgi:superfamily II DNA or RNA helicase